MLDIILSVREKIVYENLKGMEMKRIEGNNL